MVVKEDAKPEHAAGGAPEPSQDEPKADVSSAPPPGADVPDESVEPTTEGEIYDVAQVGDAGVMSPTQLGTKRFVYAAYFAAAIAVAFLLSKAVFFAWLKVQTYKPGIGEPRDEIVMPASALVGTLAAVYFWYRTRARQLAEEVAAEMAKVTWPTRTEVSNGTVVVIVTTVVSTVFFSLMDKFWLFITNLVYGGS